MSFGIPAKPRNFRSARHILRPNAVKYKKYWEAAPAPTSPAISIQDKTGGREGGCIHVS